MTSNPPSHGRRTGTERTDPPTSALFDLLASQRRRHAVAVLLDREEPITVRDLATWIAARQADEPLGDVDQDEHRRVLVSLHHVHLPRLEDAGLLRETDDGAVALASRGALQHPDVRTVIRDELDAPTAETDALLSLLSSERRRRVLSLLRCADGERSLDDVAVHVAATAGGSSDGVSGATLTSVRTQLHHVHVPKLAEFDLVEYDAATKTLAYVGHPALDTLLSLNISGTGRQIAPDDGEDVRTTEGRVNRRRP